MKTKRILNVAMAVAMTLALCAPVLAPQTALAATDYDVTITAPVNQVIRFSAADFNKNGHTFTKMTVTSLPAAEAGRLLLNNIAPVADGDILSAADTGKLSFHPKKDFSGAAVFNFDGLYGTASETGIACIMDYELTPPRARDMTIYVMKDQIYYGALSVENPNGVAARFTESTSPAHGDVTVSGTTNAFSYRPDPGFIGEDSFRFTVTHGIHSSTAVVTVYVRDMPAPVAHDSRVAVTRGQSVTSNMHATESNSTTATVTALTYRVVRDPVKGVLKWNDNGSYTYTHSGTSLGDDSFDFVANNGFRDSNVATVTFDVELPTIVYQDMTTHWAGKAAGALAGANLVVGDLIKSLYYYRPNELMTRAELAMFINSVMEYSMSTSPYSAFSDVTERHLIAPLNTAFEQGVLAGLMDGTRNFYPNRLVTRVESMRMIDNALRLNPQNAADVELAFSDRHLIPDDDLQSIRNLIGYKIVTGHNGRLNPHGQLTRAEAAELLYKAYLERKK